MKQRTWDLKVRVRGGDSDNLLEHKWHAGRALDGRSMVGL